MANIYLCSTLLWNASLEEIFNLACQSGLDGIELWAQHFFHREYDAGEFEKLPIVTDEHLIRNVLYGGVWQKYYAKFRGKETRHG